MISLMYRRWRPFVHALMMFLPRRTGAAHSLCSSGASPPRPPRHPPSRSLVHRLYGSRPRDAGEPGEHSNGRTASEDDDGWRAMSFDDLPAPPQANYDPEDFSVKQKVDLRPVTSPYKPSPVELVKVRGRDVYMKRDDLLRLEGSNVSGNKARKMFALNQMPVEDFPECIVSYGGSQSNAMVALAAVVQSKHSASPVDPGLTEQDLSGATITWRDEARIESTEEEDDTQESKNLDDKPRKPRFVYYSKKVPRFLRKNPSGNYFRALALGTDMREVSSDEYHHLFGGDSGGKATAPKGIDAPIPGDSVWIPQGGASGFAVPGCRLLAHEIVLFWSANGKGRPLSVFVPGGTCTTAVILHREIRRIIASSGSSGSSNLDIQVVVIPCVGDEGYAERQMMSLNMETGGRGEADEIPLVLKPAPDASFYLEEEDSQKYFRFGEPNADILETFRELEEYDVKVDLLYGAPAWDVLLRHWPAQEEGGETSSWIEGREIMYVHSGGLDGVNSQLMRYRHKGLVDGKDVQHPERQRRSSRPFLKKE